MHINVFALINTTNNTLVLVFLMEILVETQHKGNMTVAWLDKNWTQLQRECDELSKSIVQSM